MIIDVKGQAIYAYTGGRAHVPGQPTVVFIHGVLNDHSVWILQSRYLAHHGWNVLAIDLPGHCKSAGDAPPAWPRPPLSSSICSMPQSWRVPPWWGTAGAL